MWLRKRRSSGYDAATCAHSLGVRTGGVSAKPCWDNASRRAGQFRLRSTSSMYRRASPLDIRNLRSKPTHFSQRRRVHGENQHIIFLLVFLCVLCVSARNAFPACYTGLFMLRVRFAPSPTGFLHIGSARTFIFNWL